MSRRRASSGGDERGAVLVEMALLLPVIVSMLFGIIEFGMAFKDSQTLASATRSGARVASAEARNAGFDIDAASAVALNLSTIQSNDVPQALEIYLADPATGLPFNATKTGDEALPNASCSHCSYYTWNNLTRTWNAPTTRSWPASGSAGAQNACPFNAVTNPGGPDNLGVYLQMSHAMVTRLFGTTRTLSDRTVMKLEPQPLSSGPCSG